MSAAYPNCDLSAGAMAAIALTVLVALTIWLVGVYLAAREPGHPSRPGHTSEPGNTGG
jgi:hypothetical protein